MYQETKNKETEYELCQIIKNLKYRTNCLMTCSQERCYLYTGKKLAQERGKTALHE